LAPTTAHHIGEGVVQPDDVDRRSFRSGGPVPRDRGRACDGDPPAVRRYSNSVGLHLCKESLGFPYHVDLYVRFAGLDPRHAPPVVAYRNTRGLVALFPKGLPAFDAALHHGFGARVPTRGSPDNQLASAEQFDVRTTAGTPDYVSDQPIGSGNLAEHEF